MHVIKLSFLAAWTSHPTLIKGIQIISLSQDLSPVDNVQILSSNWKESPHSDPCPKNFNSHKYSIVQRI